MVCARAHVWRTLPRSPSRGLIEACLRPPCPTRAHSSLPRSPSRGLIEAGWHCRIADSSVYALFPGHQAGASLKRIELDRRFHAVVKLFPGHQAGASLKRRGRGQRRGQGRRLFPGHQAGASLKHNLGSASLLASATLPRSPSRGLIEAVNDEHPVVHQLQLFPGHQAGASLKPESAGSGNSFHKISSPVTKPGPH